MSDQEQERTEVKPESQHIALKIQGSGFPELVIKVKRTTKLSKMMNAYCDRAGKSLSEVRFMFEGDKLRPEMLVQDLDFDDDDFSEENPLVIDVAQEAVGGSL
ncbi:small ubiquitin-related modifier [Rhodotorula toruloides]|uniref:Small ubiquitin-related modifier n=1 Tax=Rhodotorula toruloides TaxID=5286 RepID=A0A511KKG2_RHOTO|nr:small ubiquitin-related modifier [Rhodotorula toruloides]